VQNAKVLNEEHLRGGFHSARIALHFPKTQLSPGMLVAVY
jgi:hypothetical protein